MQLQICGTAAAEGIPALFCECRVCTEARRRGGKELRSRSAYQVGDRVRIDWGPDALYHAHRLGLDYSRLRHLLLTHSHDDHWYPINLMYRNPGFANLAQRTPLHIHAVEATLDALPNGMLGDPKRADLELHPMKMWQTVELPGEDIRFTPILADHARDRICVNFILQTGDRCILQGNDTGWYPDETWAFLKDYRFDAVIFDSTSGFNDEARRNHMGCAAVVEAFERLDAMGCLNADCRRVATHFSHNGLALHDELEQRFAPHAIVPAYDGMMV